jgi:hypothetical protein
LTLGAVAVQFLDAVLGVLAVVAHVPFAGRTGHAWNGIGMAHDPDHQIVAPEVTARRRLDDLAERFMAENEPLLAGRRRAVFAVDDFAVGAADAERQCSDQ